MDENGVLVDGIDIDKILYQNDEEEMKGDYWI